MLVVVKDRCVWNKREKKSNNAVCWRYSSAEGIQRRIWKLLVQMLLGMRRLVRISLGKGGFDQLLSEKLLWSIKSMAHQTWNCACQQFVTLSFRGHPTAPHPPRAPLRGATTHKPPLWAALCAVRSHLLPQPETAGEPGWSLRPLPTPTLPRFYDSILDLGVGFPYRALLPRLQNPTTPRRCLEI